MDQSLGALFSGKICMDQWRCEFAKSFPRDWYWSMDGSSQFPISTVRETVLVLAAQSEIPPPYRATPFRDSIAEGGIAPICLVFIGYRASIAEIPLLGGGGIAPPLRMLSTEETLRKGRGGIAPNCPC